MLNWSPALDDAATRDEISYNIYTSATPGRQDFTRPSFTVQGGCSAILEAPSAVTACHVVVRAADPAGNEDDNKRELHISAADAAPVQADSVRR